MFAVIKNKVLYLYQKKNNKMGNKKIVTVWNHRGVLLNAVRLEVIESYKLGVELSDDVSDMFSYRVYETESEVRLIIDFV